MICGRPLGDAGAAEAVAPAPPRGAAGAGEAPGGISKGISKVFRVDEEGDLTAHAAALPDEAPESRFLDIEELFAGEKRSVTILAFVPLWGLWRISRSADHSGGEKILLSVLSMVSTIALAFGLSFLEPAGQDVRLESLETRIESQIETLSRIVREFVAERGHLPGEDEWSASASEADRRFYDPWGRPYVYERELDGFRIGSWGRDGKPGGRGEDADVFREFGRASAPAPPPAGASGESARHVLLAADGCPVLDLAPGTRLTLDGSVHLNALCEAPQMAIRLAAGARLEAGSTIGLVSPTPPPAEGISPGTRLGADPAADPFGDLPAPSFDGRTFVTSDRPGGLPTQHGRREEPSTRLVEGPVVLSPGIYWGGIRIVSGGEATLQPGEYVMAGGGLLVLGTGKLAGQEVLLFNTLDPASPGSLGGFEQFLCSEESQVDLSAPSSGTYQGLVLFQDRANTRPVEIRCAVALDGAIYAPSAEIRLGGPGGTLRTRVVAGRLTTQSSFTIQPPTQRSPTTADVRRRIFPAKSGIV